VRKLINQLITAALAAVNPYTAIQTHVQLNGENLIVGNNIIDITDRDIRCVAAGKAAIEMARSIHELLGSRISQGLVTKYGHLNGAKFSASWELLESAHPVPDDRSVAAGDRVWQFLADCTERTLVLACISGGASALVVAPRSWNALTQLLNQPPTIEISHATQQLIRTTLVNKAIDIANYDPESNISLPALQSIGIALLGSGLPIEKINAVRSQIDRLKGGGLVDRVDTGQVIGLILSDVIGDPIGSIASGLTNHPRAKNIFVGNNLQACEAVEKLAQVKGYHAQIMTTELDGAAWSRGVEIAREIIKQPAKTVLIYGGETIVDLPANCTGQGGRNQELGLAAAIELAKQNTLAWVTTLATDGTDGPTDAAGVLVNELTVSRARTLGLDPELALDQHDAYPFFRQLEDLHLIGATGTNVADITIAIRP
jgi:glycerate 2-kinase